MAGFTVVLNNGSTGPAYNTDNVKWQKYKQEEQCQEQICYVDVLSHLSAKETNNRRFSKSDLAYMHFKTTEDEVDDEENESRELKQSRSWFCCPGERRSEIKSIPLQIEVDEENVEKVSLALKIFENSVLKVSDSYP